MNTIIEQMIKIYEPKTVYDQKNTIKEVRAYGLNVKIDEKVKVNDSNIQSAFLKGNTKEHLLMFYSEDQIFSSVPKNEIVKIKFEVDINPPKFASFERKYRLRPIPYEVNLYDESSL